MEWGWQETNRNRWFAWINGTSLHSWYREWWRVFWCGNFVYEHFGLGDVLDLIYVFESLVSVTITILMQDSLIVIQCWDALCIVFQVCFPIHVRTVRLGAPRAVINITYNSLQDGCNEHMLRNGEKQRRKTWWSMEITGTKSRRPKSNVPTFTTWLSPVLRFVVSLRCSVRFRRGEGRKRVKVRRVRQSSSAEVRMFSNKLQQRYMIGTLLCASIKP